MVSRQDGFHSITPSFTSKLGTLRRGGHGSDDLQMVEGSKTQALLPREAAA